MIKVKSINGSPTINENRCSFETDQIRTEILAFSKVNDEFILPDKYTYEITELNGFAKIKLKSRAQYFDKLG